MDSPSLQLVCDIGDELGGLKRFNKGLFLKSLKQAATALSDIEQPPVDGASAKREALKELDAATKPLRKSIIKHGLLKQNDKDVRLFVAICISEFFRILAPEPPFEDKYLRDVFQLFVSIFKELGDTTCPFFSRRLKILDTVARCKCFVIMLDIDCNDLVVEMFKIFFSTVSEHHQQNLINDILSIMTHVLHEEVTAPLMEVILQNLVKQEKDVPSAAAQLAVSVIQGCVEQLQPFVCGFLSSCFLDRDAVGSELKEVYHDIMFEIFKCAPEMLFAVIPNLIHELVVDQVDVRIKAVSLIGKLFALPENHIVDKYHDLFMEFLKRFSDKSAEVRVIVLQSAKVFYLANPTGKESREVLTALESRLLDFDDRVRMEAVIIACDIAKSNLKFAPARLLFEAMERIRDKKMSVRKKALQKLLEVYREYCKNCADGRMTLCNHFEQIPCKILMLCYDKDCKEFRSQTIEQVLMDELFPTMNVEEKTRHWVYLFSLFTPLHVKALNSILSQKQRLRVEMQFYLSLRKREKENCAEETQKKLKATFAKMSVLLPDPSKSEDCFQRLNRMKNNSIFNALEELLGQLTTKGGQNAKDKFLKLIGDKHPDYEFLQLLCSRCLYIFDSEHVQCILEDLLCDRLGDKHLEVSAVKFLQVIINAFPSLLRGSEVNILKLLEANDLIDDKLIEVLAKAGHHISVNYCDFQHVLERWCLEGTRVQSKYAVSAIAALSGTSTQITLTEVCKKLVDSLHKGLNISTVLQSLGCIAQHSVSIFESQDDKITPYIYQNVIQVVPKDLIVPCNQNYRHAASSELKVYGLKTLVKSFLPHRGSQIKRNIRVLLDVLSKMINKTDALSELESCGSINSQIRVAAAKSILRLSRRWDLHISPDIFYSTVMMAKDPSFFVRRSLIDKTHKLLKVHAMPVRYACLFALATSDCQKDLRNDSLKFMEEFIKDYSKEARFRQNSSAQAVSITDHPAYIVVFLIHVIAHDPGFPLDHCKDNEKLTQFFGPLFSLLQALVNANVLDNDMDLVQDNILYLICISSAIKRAVDAVDAKKTSNLHILADIVITIVKELNQNGKSSTQFPGPILLPSSLYQFSHAKKSEEGNSDGVSQFNSDQEIVQRVVNIFRLQVYLPAKTLPKRTQQNPEAGISSDAIGNSTSNLTANNQFDLPAIYVTKPNKKNFRQETSIRSKRKRAASPVALAAVELHNKCGTIASNSDNGPSTTCEVILEKELRSSCGSVTTGPPHSEPKISSQSTDGNAPPKETFDPISSNTTEVLKSQSVKLKEFSAKHEATSVKHIKSISTLDKSSSLSSVDGHKTQVSAFKEVLVLEDIDHLQHDLNRTADSFRDDAATVPTTLSTEQGKFACRMKLLSAKEKKRQKASVDKSASEVINIDEDVVGRRTRSRKGTVLRQQNV